jgi:hypothetical protein
VAGDLPVKKDIFHLWPCANVVHDYVAAGKQGLPVHHHANVSQPATQVLGHQVAWIVIIGAICDRQAFAFAAEEDHQIGHAAVVDVRVRLASSPFSGICAEIRRHVLMHFFLQIDSQCPIGANHLVRANSDIGGHVSAGINETNIGWIVADGVLRAVKRRSGKLPKKSLPCLRSPWKLPKLRRKHTCSNHGEQSKPTASFPATLHSPKIDTE